MIKKNISQGNKIKKPAKNIEERLVRYKTIRAEFALYKETYFRNNNKEKAENSLKFHGIKRYIKQMLTYDHNNEQDK